LLLALVLVQRESVQRVREEQRITQRKAHLANLAAVDAGLRSGEIGEAQRRLAAVQPEPGGFEWGHLRLQADSAERVLEVGGKVTDVAAAPGGELVAVASEERVVLWPLAQGAEPRELALGALVLCLAFSPDGSELALGLGDGSIARLDAHDLAERSRLHAHAQAVTRLAYSRSGASLASTSLLGNSLRVDRQAGEPLQASTALPSDIAFLDEGVLVLGSSEEPAVVRFLDARTLAEQRRIEAGPGRVEALAASSDGARFAVGLLDGRVLLFDATAEAPRAELEAHQGMIRGLAFDTSGELLASAGVDLSIGLWRAADGALIERRLGHTEHPSSIAFLEGAGAMISGASDGSARLWSVAGGAEVILRAPGGWVEALAFVQDRPLFFSLDWRPALCLWDAAKGEPVFTLDLEERANCLAASPREPRVAYAIEQSVVVFDHVRQREVQRFGLAPAHALSVAYGSKGQVLARTSAGELVELVPGAPPRRITEGLGGLNGAFALAPGDERAAVVAGAGRVLEVDLAGSAPPRAIEVPVDEVSALEFDLLGERLFVGSVGGDAFLLDAADGSELAALRGHDGRVTAAAFAPDGRIATGSADRTLRIWDGPDTLLVLRGHGDWVSDLGFDASGTCLASASRDGTLRLWRARPPALSPSR
jgi:WD40 repeat protein